MQAINIPVIIAHFSENPSYLKYALKSAANFNNTVVLIGDENNKNSWANHWDITLVDCDKYQEFQKYYVKMSDYPKQYEDGFWKRMFVLEKWMKDSGYQQVFLLDSDIITFADYSQEIAPILSNTCIAAFSTPENQDNYRWGSSCHFSYWTLEGLEDFTNFCIEAYQNQNIREKLNTKWQWHIDNKKPGGVTEMTMLYLWSQGNSQVANVAKVINNMTVDHNINTSDNYFKNEYQTQFRLKKFIFTNGIPYGYNKRLNKEIRFLCLHCQGKAAKSAMKFLYDKNLRKFYYFANIFALTILNAKLFTKKIISNK